jgi:hypothetical protein
MVEPQYAAWIAEHCQGVVAGFCHSASEAMKKAFPELILCRGYYMSDIDGSRAHWWLKTPGGEIVDPTVHQFMAGREGSYEEYKLEDHGPLPIGKCMNCGDEVYASDNPPASSMCSQECLDSFDRHLKEVRSS